MTDRNFKILLVLWSIFGVLWVGSAVLHLVSVLSR